MGNLHFVLDNHVTHSFNGEGMMVKTINTDFGKIELNKKTKEAYFHVWDYISPIDENGVFKGWHGEVFRVCWGLGTMDIVIEKSDWKEIGRAS